MPKVIIAGGGVAGMSAAHELIERGFDVEIFENQPKYVGGKARSTDVQDTAAPGKKALPGEHGFRFFPGFYKHVTDTMKRIPFEGNRKGVYDNLTSTKRVVMGREGMDEILTLVNFPKNAEDLKVMAKAFGTSNTGISEADFDAFADKIWQLMTSCYDRRLQDYERMAWWDYTDADQHSEAYQKFFVGGITRTLVAAKPRKVSTRTGGDILLQLIYQMANPFTNTDRVLNGPTNEAWLYPWRDYLIRQGVKYHHDHHVEAIHCSSASEKESAEITGILVKDESGNERVVTGDYYISAVPVERMSQLLNPEIIKADVGLSTIKDLAGDVQWMTGIQFYLKENVEIAPGHIMIVDSPWAITAISQPQFWEYINMEDYGDGKVNGVISVDVSDWNQKGFNGKAAKECTKQEIMEEVWFQLTLGLNKDGKSILESSMVLAANLDRDIQFQDPKDDGKLDVSKLKNGQMPEGGVPGEVGEIVPGEKKKDFKTIDKEPLLVNRVRTWDLRPEAYTRIPNLFLASDYVRTHTDLATMEGANEAARRAVNAIIEASGVEKPLCKIWKLHEPFILSIFRWYDQSRFNKGLAWNENFPWLLRLAHSVMALVYKLINKFK